MNMKVSTGTLKRCKIFSATRTLICFASGIKSIRNVIEAVGFLFD